MTTAVLPSETSHPGRVTLPPDLAAEVEPHGRVIGPSSIPWRPSIPAERDVLVLYGREARDAGVIGGLYGGAHALCEEAVRCGGSWVWARAWALVGSASTPGSLPVVYGQRVLILDAPEWAASAIGRVGYYQPAQNSGGEIGVVVPDLPWVARATRWALLPCVIPAPVESLEESK